MDFVTFWEGVRASLGLDDAHAVETVTNVIKILFVVFLTVWVAHWVSEWIRRAAKGDAATPRRE